jgi:hypothetical protein
MWPGFAPWAVANGAAANLNARVWRPTQDDAQPDLRDPAQHVRAVWMRSEGDVPAERPPLHAFFTETMLAVAQRLGGDHGPAMWGLDEARAQAARCESLSGEVNALLINAGSQQFDLCSLEDTRPMLEQCMDGALAWVRAGGPSSPPAS